jgi:hypothetical protein
MIILITFRERQYAMGMEVELVLLAALIVIFVISFCALLQKIRKTYENDRELTERVTSVSSQQLSLTEIYINPTFTSENENGGNNNSQGVFPCAPPPYTGKVRAFFAWFLMSSFRNVL